MSDVTMLSERHRRSLVEESGISQEVIEERGYRTITKKSALKQLGFGPTQCLVDALLIPIFSPAATSPVSYYEAVMVDPMNAIGEPPAEPQPEGEQAE